MDYNTFERKERKRYLEMTKEATQMALSYLSADSINIIQKEVEKGLEEGTEDFCLQDGNLQTIYHADLSDFLNDYSTGRRISSRLDRLAIGIKPNHIIDYSLDECEGYATYILNESSARFKKQFPTE